MVKRRKLVDPKCHELAVHLYTDYPPRAKNLADEERQVDDLAATIQGAIEDWFQEREAAFDR